MTVAVHVTQPVRATVDEIVPRLIADLVASRVTAGDPTLWGPDAEAEASTRLGWVDAVSVSRPLVAEIVALRDDLA
ncbi:MAG TPA: glucose-6-phosphate isomerase, partial [Microbacterium sp.]|nr:glucose-6-phosphate isomerase [Microbacterium sp.]